MFSECPYKASNKSICSHKGTSRNRKGKRYCVYSQASKCDLFREWKVKRKNVKIKGLDVLETTGEVEDD